MSGVIKNNNNKWWQLFKTGRHITASGEEFNADANKIDLIIKATKNHIYANDEIPVCIGHKKDDSPKWGAFKKESFQRAGEYLVGKYDYLVTEFAEYINRKMFDKVSIALYPDLAIKHIAILGVQAPAIKGLQPIEMNECSDNETFVEINFDGFSEYDKGFNLAGFLKEIKNYLERKIYPGESDAIVPGPSFSEINNPDTNTVFNNDPINNNKENNMPDKTTVQTPQEFAEKLSVYEKQIADLNQRLLESEIKEFCESPEMVKKITPALLPFVKQIYTDLSLTAGQEFSEEENGNAKSTKLQSFIKILSALPDSVQFSEFATKEKAGVTEEPGMMEFAEMTVNDEAMDLHRKALKIQSNEKCSYVEAVRIASRS